MTASAGATAGSGTGASSAPGSALDAYLASFAEPVGYLNFGSYGPPSRDVVETITRLATAASAGVPSSGLHAEDERALAAVARLSGLDESGVALASSTSLGLMQIAFGLPRGEVVVSSAEFPSNLYAWWRSEEAGLTTVRPLPVVPGQPLAPVTPERVADAVGPDTVAVAVSAVDFRTGTVADLAGLREAVGDRLLVVDGIRASVCSTPTGPSPTPSSSVVRSGCGRGGVRGSWRCRRGLSRASVRFWVVGRVSRAPRGTTVCRTSRCPGRSVCR